jgi:6-phospho-beta-glucosidase
MRIVIIGGSSFSTPNLIKYLDSTENARSMSIVLAGRSRSRIEAVERACKVRVRSGLEIRTELLGAGNWKITLAGADVVLVQIRVCGLRGRMFDETFPLKYGLCGDEGLGVGGISAGWRTWPILASLLDAISRFCPQAFVILLTSPLSILVRASLTSFDLNLVGVCELPWTTLQELAQCLCRPHEEIDADYLGINHIGWFFNIRSKGFDVFQELATKQRTFPAHEFFTHHGCVPTRYLKLHYESANVLAQQTSQTKCRSEFLVQIQQRAFLAYGDGDLKDIDAAVGARPTPWYSQSVGPLLEAANGNKIDIPFFISARNGAYVRMFAADDIIECRSHWTSGELQRSPLSSDVPAHVGDNLLPFVQFERVATEAIVSRSTSLLRECISLHPWVRDQAQVAQIADEIVATNDAMVRTECQA